MLPLLLGGLGLGGLQAVNNAQASKAENERNAATMQYSPWTGMKPGAKTKSVNPVGDLAAGALSGYTQGQSLKRADLVNSLLKNSVDKGSGASALGGGFTYNSPWFGRLGG